MKHIKQITAAALSALMLGSLTVPVLADSAQSAKEEVIYVMTDASGMVTDIEAVNIFAGGDITDYGDYTNVKMLNTDDIITQEGDKITFSSDAAKVYYQGTMKSTVIPWDISIRYYLDGNEYSAGELAGKSGALEIRFSVSKNEDCNGSFYDDYALQASFTLDTEHCKNIIADDATAANVGSDKQLTYTILPGKGINTSIKADVTDFEMDAVAINGVRLNLNIEVDDSELMDKVNEIMDAVVNLDDGAVELDDGAEELSDATDELRDKVGDLYSGVGELCDGAGELYDGLVAIAAKNDTLNNGASAIYEGLCTAAAAALNAQLEENGIDSVSLTPDNYSDVLAALSKQLEKYDLEALVREQVEKQVEEQADSLYQKAAAEIVKNQYGEEYLAGEQGQAAVEAVLGEMDDDDKKDIVEAYVDQLMEDDDVVDQIDAAGEKIDAAEEQISKLKTQLDSCGTFCAGISEYTAAVSTAASGAKKLDSSMDTLYSSIKKLRNAVRELDDGASDLYDGTQDLRDGTSEFVERTSDMDTEVTNEIDTMTSSVSGGDGETVSFVSEKNTDVESVQFVIKTAAIEKPEDNTADAAEEVPLTFWQKLLRLFGLY